MTDLQFFISLWDRLEIKYYKVDENNAFVTYEVDIEDSYDCDVDNEIYCFELASKNAPGIKMTPGADGRISCGCGRAGTPGSVQP